jgi:ABC-type glycerol-3-phosphate transport system substrate-binding protein
MSRRPSTSIHRRDLLRGFGALGLVWAAPVLVAACGGSTPAASTPAPAANTPAVAASAPTTAVATPTAAPQAAASTPASSAQATLTFWKSPHSPQEDQLWQPILGDFQKQNPSIQVTHTVIPWADFDTKFTAGFASGQPPDVFYMPDEWIPKYASQGQMIDLGTFATTGKLTDQYPQVFWTSCTYKGKPYGIPFLAVVQGILINQSLFDSAGVAIPKTWDDIRAAAKKLTDTAKGTYGLNLNDQNATAPILATAGATVMSADLHQIAANSDAGVQSWTVSFQNIGATDKAMVPLSFSADQVTSLSLKGKIAMMWQEESQIVAQYRKQAPDMKLDVIPLPKVDGTSGHESAWYNVGFMCESQQTKFAQQGQQLITFLSTKDVQQRYVIAGVDLVPAMKGVTPTNLDPVVAKYLTFIPEGIGPTVSTHWPDVKIKLQQTAQAVISGQKPAKQALDEFASAINSELDGN